MGEIDKLLGGHPNAGARLEGSWFQTGFIEGFTNALIEGAQRRVEIPRWLVERHIDWDLFLMVMSEAHAAGHHRWHGIDGRHPP